MRDRTYKEKAASSDLGGVFKHYNPIFTTTRKFAQVDNFQPLSRLLEKIINSLGEALHD